MGKIWLALDGGGFAKKETAAVSASPFCVLSECRRPRRAERVFADCQIGGQKRITLMLLRLVRLEFQEAPKRRNGERALDVWKRSG